eukprot:m.83847 g.83847  ORF g.83847 m.83847 type:complete len:398 (+) comp9563_c0_seq1:171-1364(+)
MDPARELETENARRKKESEQLLEYLKTTEHGGDAIRCPVCNTSGKFRKDMILYVSEKCGHEACDSCLRGRYESRATAPCHDTSCNLKLRRSDFKEKRFLKGGMHLEMAVREELAKVCAATHTPLAMCTDLRPCPHLTVMFHRMDPHGPTQVYCKTQDDFETAAAYDEYLEEVESIVFDRVHGDEAAQAAAREKVDAYRKKHTLEIESRQREAKYARKRKREAIKDEMKATQDRRHQQYLEHAKTRVETRREKDRLKQALLRTTNRDDVKRILEELRMLKARKLQQALAPASDDSHSDNEMDATAGAATAAVPAAAGGGTHVPEAFPRYVYTPIRAPRSVAGPLAPHTPMLVPQLASLSLSGTPDATQLPYVGATGHCPKDIAKRALQDAFSCLFLSL